MTSRSSNPPGPGRRAVELSAFTGEVAAELEIPDLETEVARLTDPSAAVETLHWGRNYLYRAVLETAAGPRDAPVDVVVKQFRTQGRLDALRRRLRGSKAALSWQMAWRFLDAGLPTAPPLLWLESKRPQGPSFFITAYLKGVTEARYLLRAANEGRLEEDFPQIDFPGFLERLGQLLRRMHEAQIWHRDLSIGNVLLAPVGNVPDPVVPELYIVDLNRARGGRKLTSSERARDLCRLALFRPEHQEALLRAYWGREPHGYERRLYRFYHRGFLRKIETKKQIRGGLRSFRELFKVRRPHAHIPQAPEGASARDKIVWDHLSDQPHQHASRLEKLLVRATDLGGHLESAATVALAVPRIGIRYRRLKRQLPEPWSGALEDHPSLGVPSPAPVLGELGIGLRPYPENPEALLAAIDDLGARSALLRLHPWQDEHDAEEELARELAGRGIELSFSLPQNRQLVKDPERWQASIEELAERFLPFGRTFQIGQAINRSKWGVWNPREYVELADRAAEVLRARGDVQLLGPAVIDFEYHATAAMLNLRRLKMSFDAVAALLYVDRRGAPENLQAGLDTVGKVVLLKAIAETAKKSSGRCWITEVNWPLWEGPHSPAGKDVSVDEESQADYLVRYALLALGTGMVERVFWWQLVARGYGLATPAEDGLRRRPSFQAMATLLRELRGAGILGPLTAAEPARLYLFQRQGFEDPAKGLTVVGWSTGEAVAVRPEALAGRSFQRVVERDGGESSLPDSGELRLTASPRYFHLAD
ncbi:MAG: lipopolysaccharide kinase InaA family protein [Acidobacteriota bacterium]|nr:lipopolysaccharide kinase InaA family protein [Acidobacteriota bacterium]